MIIYLVQSAGDLTGSLGYGAAMLDAEVNKVLVTYADESFKRRYTILPHPEHPQWSKRYNPSMSVEVFKAATSSIAK